MDDEQMRISEAGILEALQILEREGYLPEPTESIDVDAIQLKEAADKYVEASIAKGSERTNKECREAILIAYFQAYLADLTRALIN